MNTKAKWIKAVDSLVDICPDFRKSFRAAKKIKHAEACVSALGLYNLYVNGKKIGDHVFTPGYTSYKNRVQFQRYDLTDALSDENEFSILAAKGWCFGALGSPPRPEQTTSEICVIASFEFTYEGGEKEILVTDETWDVYSSKLLYSEHYNGEVIDPTAKTEKLGSALLSPENKPTLIEQVGEYVCEHERVYPSELIITPKGERVIDFGQNMAGYVELRIKGERGAKIEISHAEILDKEGNFYTDNLRSASELMTYTLSGEEDVLKPLFTFQGFRYIRLDKYPFNEIDLDSFTAIAVYSDMKRTGRFECGYPKLNQLYSNTVWGQRSNFIDIPTDCPQRDERLGWTGDANVFCRTAAINYDVEKFFYKWFGDIALEQSPEGGVHGVVPDCGVNGQRFSTVWGDVAVSAPWEIYKAYGNLENLRTQFPMMKKWVEYMHGAGEEEHLWLGGNHYGDWLAMDAGYGIYIGATQTDFIASAFYSQMAKICAKAARALGEDADAEYYEDLAAKVRKRFREVFMKDGMPVVLPKYDALATNRHVNNLTQTALVLILYIGLYEENEKNALVDKLVELICENGGRMTTGFVGTPFILHVLSDFGRTDVAFDLLLQEKNPSWLFSVNMGATTIWEHWDSVNEDYKMWSVKMNSFNHYAYGSVFDWIYGDMLGIKLPDDGAGYSKVEIAPLADKRIGFASGSIDTRSGRIASSWRYIGDKVRYEFEIPENTTATIKIPGLEPKTVSGAKLTIIK